MRNKLYKEKKRIPPTIKELPQKTATKSARVEKERQGRLFTAASVKELPAIGLLDAWQETNKSGFSKESLSAMSKLLELKLKDFGIDIEVIAVNPGPVITRFEVQPAPGVKVSRISNLVKERIMKSDGKIMIGIVTHVRRGVGLAFKRVTVEYRAKNSKKGEKSQKITVWKWK